VISSADSSSKTTLAKKQALRTALNWTSTGSVFPAPPHPTLTPPSINVCQFKKPICKTAAFAMKVTLFAVFAKILIPCRGSALRITNFKLPIVLITQPLIFAVNVPLDIE
jgi:hypothetical protein